MTIASFFNKFKSRFLWLNLLGMFCVVIIFVVILIFGMNIYTRHGKSISVPDLRGKMYTEVERLLEEAELSIVIVDTDYVKSMPDGCVLEQMPIAGSKVKAGRQIFVTVNSLKTPMLTLPNIIDNTSLREATAKLKAMGFKLGTPQAVYGDADWVYGVLANGRSVNNGDRIASDKILVIQYGGGIDNAEEDSLYLDELLEQELLGEDGGYSGDDFEEI